MFYYHTTNACYKTYTMKSKLEALISRQNKNKICVETAESPNTSETSQIRTRAQSKCPKNVSVTLLCIICNYQSKYENEIVKYRICEKNRAETFLKISRHFQDDVFTRTANLKSFSDVFAADIYYHPNCMRMYERKFDKFCKGEEEVERESATTAFDPILTTIKSIESKFKDGEAFTLTQIRTLVNESFNLSIRNDEVKSKLIDYFGPDVCFSYPREANKSTLAFYSKINTANMADKIRSYDPVTECSELLKKSLEDCHFNLEDKFCDEHDLNDSWKNFTLPPVFQKLFMNIFGINKTDFIAAADLDRNTNDCQEVDGSVIKMLRVKAIFQSMFYTYHNGTKRTPLHVATGLSVHSTCKSRLLITSLNRTGVSISYDEIQRIRSNLASFTAAESKNHVPLPSHFDRSLFTTAAFDNFDHDEATLSGLNSSHDTVAVLFQDSNEINKKKPNISETEVNHRKRRFGDTLKCQELKTFNKPSKPVTLPDDYLTSPWTFDVTDHFEYFSQMHQMDVTWILSRMHLPTIEQDSPTSEQKIPSWSAFNSILTEDNRVKQRVGFLPVLPHPVTDYATVYTALCNFVDILKQLDQKFLPIACDEGVYKIARHIKFICQGEFDNLQLFLGGFHIAKILFGCIGKYLKGSGIENVFIETGLFGVNVTEQMLSGTHYTRAIKGFFILSEALLRLQFNEFFSDQQQEKFNKEIKVLQEFKEEMSCGNVDKSQLKLKEFCALSENLLSEFAQFRKKRSIESDLFKYWDIVLTLISIVRDLIRADREGNWLLHLETMKKLQPIFQAMDRINYARWSSVYLEDMLMLPTQAPEVYEKFLEGRFAVKQSNTPFTSVGTDQRLEQTINKSQKSSGGIIGMTREKGYVAAWNMVYHEILAVNKFYRETTLVDKNNAELKMHHEYSRSYTDNTEAAVEKIMLYFQNQINPFAPGAQPLRNITTEQLVDPTTTKRLLNIFEIGCEKYKKYKQDRFVDRTTPISAVIHRTNLPSFTDTNKPELKNVKASKTQKSHVEAKRLLNLATERQYDLKRFLSFDLVADNPLFESNGLLKKETAKSNLIKELEKSLQQSDYVIKDGDLGIIVDVMLICRKINWNGLNSFKDFAVAITKHVTSSMPADCKITRIDFIFDAYFNFSLKSTERLRRGADSITIHRIDENVPLPKQEKKFWSNNSNKVKLQKFLHDYLLKNAANIWPEKNVVCSGTDELMCKATKSNSTCLFMLQRSDIEEADSRIMLHIQHSIIEGSRRIYVVSSDTDVIVLALNFWRQFETAGVKVQLQELKYTLL